MKKYVIELTEAEDKALSIFATDQNEWIQNAVHARCQHAIDEIVSIEVQRLLAEGKPITGTKEDIVLSCEMETAAVRQAKLEEEYKKLQEEQQG